MMARCYLVRSVCICIQTQHMTVFWQIPWTEELGVGLQSMGPQRFGRDRVTEHAFELRLVLTGLLL